jgi:large subunit ribosomal protein L33
MAKKGKKAREYVFLECPKCGNRNYRTPRSMRAGSTKLTLKKYCSTCRTHVEHKEKKR